MRGLDLNCYKRTCLCRRIKHRMQMLDIDSFERYHQHLAADDREPDELLATVFVNVTRFFRDFNVWRYLIEQGIPDLLRKRAAHKPVRVWNAGCSTGEE